MKNIRKLIFSMLVFTMFLCVKTDVYADAEQISPAFLDEAKEDPLYAQYHNAFSLMSAGSKYTIATAKKKIVHQSRFDSKYNKVYGIDVSKWQGNIDWEKVKADGVDFAIIRLGYRGMDSGTLALDSYFEQNIKAAHAAGVDIGIYFFTQAITASEAKKEAEYCIQKLAPYKSYVSYPVMIDIEPSGGRLDKANLSKAAKTSICSNFCSTIEAAGYTSGIYCSKSYFSSWLNMEKLENTYYVWLAHYTDNTDYTGKFDMWQFSSRCSVNGISGYVDMDVCYIPVTPGAPKNLTQTKGTVDSVSLSWGAVVGADGYKIYQYKSDGTLEASYTSTEPVLTIGNLTKGKTYYYKVRAYSIYIDGTKKYSKYTAQLPAYTTPGDMAGLKTEARTDTTVTIAWNKISGVSGYRVRMYDAATGTYITVKNVTTNSYTIADLSPAASYVIKVQAYVKMNGTTKLYGAYSAETKIYTQPAMVTSVKISDLQKKSMTISWKKQSNVLGYRVYLYNSKGKQISKADTSVNSYCIKGLTTGTAYSVKVRAFYAKENGTVIYGALTTKMNVTTLPAKVTGIKQSNVTTDSLQLTWKKKTGASGYKVYLYDSTAKAYKKVKTTTGNSYTLKKLKAGKKYKVKVVTYVLNGTKTYAAEESDIYQAVAKPANVRSLKQTGKTKNTVSISWAKTARATGYQLKIYNSKKKLVGTYTTGTTSYKFKKLSGRYTVKVRAYVKSSNTTAYSTNYTSILVYTR